MRRYNVATAALALDVEPKWVDNALARLDLPGLFPRARGKARLLTQENVLALFLARRLSLALDVSLAKSLELAAQLARDGGVERDGFRLAVDSTQAREYLANRLAASVEAVIVPRRGRPRR